MSDQLDALFAEVRGVQPPATFAPAEQVRRRGRQRTRRKALAAGAGVLAVTAMVAGLGAGLAQPGPDGVGPLPADSTPTAAAPTTPPATASPTPSRTATPSRKAGGPLLQPDDLGPGNWRRFGAEQMQNADHWFWGFWADTCPAYRSSRFRSLPHQKTVETVAYRAVANGDDNNMSQIIERYDAGWGDDNLDDVRAVIELCAEALAGAPGELVTVVDEGFTGDESLLVKSELWYFEGKKLAPAPLVAHIAVVRVGDVVTTVRAYPSDPDRVRSLAERAAERLG